MDMLKEKESSIQKSILDYGKIKKIKMRRMNVIGTPTKDGFRPSANKGMADIHAEKKIWEIPVSVWFEVKTKKGRLSEHQKIFKQDVENYGGYYFVVRSIEEVEKAFTEVAICTMEKINKMTKSLKGL